MRHTTLIPILLVATLAGCKSSRPASVFVDPALALLVPSDTILLVGTRLEPLRATPAYQKFIAKRSFPQLDDFAQRTGVDARKDIWELLFCSNGKTGLLMGRGKFSTEMEPRLVQQGATRFGYKGHTLFGNEQSAVLFVNTSVAVIGPTSGLRSLVDQRDTGKTGMPPAMAEHLKTIPYDTQLWAVYTGGPVSLPIPSGSNLTNLDRIARSIQTATLYADMRIGLKATVGGQCTNDQGATQIHDFLKGMIGMGRLSTPDNRPDLLRLYDTIHVEKNQRTVTASADVPQDLVDQFIATFFR